MDEFRGNHIPPFGSWDCNNNLPFTQCFETARQAGFIGYGYTYSYPQDRDLYVAGDLYENNVVTPAMIVVPRRRLDRKKGPVRGSKKVVCDYDYEFVPEVKVVKSKAVDEDLYKISPDLLRVPPRRKSKRWGLFSMCMQAACVM
ncbi:hypothetical protein M8C21_021531 [Ambrosia artemisiifolia]|uniref:RIN4 pathogenic type III effector avirulence factor Avr cleavage site domain-containing protein n=1 Tax=Ambrosia artemisiifolia TaxID=4212 RepID=A0AAD5GFF6_AMBAR|nr:hypothetical protein M8C21_021531 [Ambrosia artemisiifolia]